MTRAWLGLLVGCFLVGSTVAGQDTLEQRVRKLEERLRALEAQGGDAGANFQVTWRDGLRFATQDRAFRFQVGGRIHNDWIFPVHARERDENFLGADERSAVLFRRSRIYLKGTLYERVIFKAQYDFAGAAIAFRDVYLGLKGLPVLGTVKVGQFKEPFSLEEVTSSNFITFMERALPNAFAPARNTGVMAESTCAEGHVYYALGLFRSTPASGNRVTGSKGSEYNVTARLTGIPVYEEDGETLLHVGVAASYRNPNNDALRVASRAEIRSTNRFAGVMLPAETLALYQGELAFVAGPFSAQGEYVHASVAGKAGVGHPQFKGWYVQASCFLTPEDHRGYDRKHARFSRVHPTKNFLEDGGLGALELALRVSNLDLDATGLGLPAKGGNLFGYTAGLNWYLNPNTRVMANFVIADRDNINAFQFFGMRFQIDF